MPPEKFWKIATNENNNLGSIVSTGQKFPIIRQDFSSRAKICIVLNSLEDSNHCQLGPSHGLSAYYPVAVCYISIESSWNYFGPSRTALTIREFARPSTPDAIKRPQTTCDRSTRWGSSQLTGQRRVPLVPSAARNTLHYISVRDGQICVKCLFDSTVFIWFDIRQN